MIFIKVLLLDNWTEKARAKLGEVAETSGYTEDEEVEGVIPSLDYYLNKQRINYFPNLKFIASCTTGLDHIDLEYCKAKGIKIISLQGERDFLSDVWATAEHTMALILSLVRKIPFAHNDVCAGNWNREAWQGTELRNKTLGIVGYGRVGRQVAKIAEAFGMHVTYCDKYVEQKVLYPPWERDFEALLKNSDIITVHVPLNDETRNMFGAKEFAMMKPTAYFINTSRGAVVDEKALWYALRNKQISGAALDVMCGEPDVGIDWPVVLGETNNCIITPHLAGNSAESREKCQLFIVDKIKQFIQGGG